MGGSGGGSLELAAIGALSVDSITMKGVTGTVSSSSVASGAGGAGGGILLSGSTVSVSGTLDASGGNGTGLTRVAVAAEELHCPESAVIRLAEPPSRLI